MIVVNSSSSEHYYCFLLLSFSLHLGPINVCIMTKLLSAVKFSDSELCFLGLVCLRMSVLLFNVPIMSIDSLQFIGEK